MEFLVPPMSPAAANVNMRSAPRASSIARGTAVTMRTPVSTKAIEKPRFVNRPLRCSENRAAPYLSCLAGVKIRTRRTPTRQEAGLLPNSCASVGLAGGSGPIAALLPIDESHLLEPCEVVSNELPTNPEQPSDFAGPAAARPPQDKQDPKSEVPVVPVLREELIALRLRFDAFRIVSNASVRALARNESRAGEDFNVVNHGSVSELEQPRNRPEVVPRKHQQMSVDATAGRMVEAVSSHPAIHHHSSCAPSRRLPRWRRFESEFVLTFPVQKRGTRWRV